MAIKPQPKDIEQVTIQGGLSGITPVQNLTTSSGIWYEVILEAEESKQVILQPRDRVDWYYSTVSGGSYFTFRGGAAWEANFVAVSGTTIGWVSTNADTTLEILIGR